MPREILKCFSCGFIVRENRYFWKCPKCGNPLNIQYEEIEYPSLKDLLNARGLGIWKFSKWFPEVEEKNRITLGEGNTPVIKRRIGGVDVFFKLEYLNPTGSFKDRGAALTISKVLSFKYKNIVEDSSGNAGISISCYGYVGNLNVRIYVPKTSIQSKLNIIKICGANIIETINRSEASYRAVNELRPTDIYVGHLWNPYFVEGLKSAAYELPTQVKELNDVSAVIIPTSSGGNLLGYYYGFKDLVNGGVISHIPKIIAVQAQYPAPIYESLRNVKVNLPETKLADGLKVSKPPRLREVISALKYSEGDAIIVKDDEILQALKQLIKMGFIVEPTSATAFAAYIKLLEEKKIEVGDKVIIPLTGSGIKASETLLNLVKVR